MTEPLTPPQGPTLIKGFPDFSVVKKKKSACNKRDGGSVSSIPGSGRFPGENPLQYSCLDNPTDRGAWWTTIHGVTKSMGSRLSMRTWAWAWSLITSQMPHLQMSSFWSLGLPCVDLDGREGSHSVHSKQDCRKTEAKWEGVSFGGKGVLCTVSEELRGMKWKDIWIFWIFIIKHERWISSLPEVTPGVSVAHTNSSHLHPTSSSSHSRGQNYGHRGSCLPDSAKYHVVF